MPCTNIGSGHVRLMEIYGGVINSGEKMLLYNKFKLVNIRTCMALLYLNFATQLLKYCIDTATQIVHRGLVVTLA